MVAGIRHRVSLGLLAALVSAPIYAQPASSPALTNPSTISFEHDAKDVTGFAAYVQAKSGGPRRVDLGSLQPDASGKIVVPMPPLPPGTYSISIAAYNQAGESARVDAQPSRFEVTAPVPSSVAPSAIRQPADHPQDAAVAPREREVAKPPTPMPEQKAKPAAPKQKRGFLGRLYRAVVGEDEPEPE
jgi:hypothetical protein